MKIVINSSDKGNRWTKALSIIAIGISLVAVVINYVMYIETTKPHIEFNELQDRLKALDNQIDKAESWIGKNEGHKNYSYWIENLSQAKVSSKNAWEQWNNYNFTKSEGYITISYNSLDHIPIDVELAEVEFAWIIVLVIVMVAIIILILVLFKTGYIYIDNEKPGKKK